MQFLTTALSILSLSCAALACTRSSITFVSPEPVLTLDDQTKFGAACTVLKTTMAEFSATNDNIYGPDLTNRFICCNSAGNTSAPMCHCSVTAWRFHEWQTTENKYDLGPWAIRTNWTAIDDKVVSC
ncbi:hypothetical protein DHEL01_v212330 [Diaporthe helianthi]|uniref:Avirulence Effector AvrLm4-7 domain-containing protein n=1 Tax=Diaporthe helianthi TaxID=158607 RepID=A0A2P5HGA0_DIAHE|nr:hypothetical protein DHEL01_v212330 [Diaporthe helianthi]